LKSLKHAASNVEHEFFGASCIAPTAEPRKNELGIGVDAYERPNVAVAKFALLVGREIFFLGVAE
jgi:hypothetical protein